MGAFALPGMAVLPTRMLVSNVLLANTNCYQVMQYVTQIVPLVLVPISGPSIIQLVEVAGLENTQYLLAIWDAFRAIRVSLP